MPPLRRWCLPLAAWLAAGLAATAPAATAAPDQTTPWQCTAQPNAWPVTTCNSDGSLHLHDLLSGAQASPYAGTDVGTVVSHDSLLQSYSNNPSLQINGVRQYRRWNQALFTADDTTIVQHGMTLFLSVQARNTNGSYIPWADIGDATATNADSAYYARIVKLGQLIQQFGQANAAYPGHEVYFIFNHEPEEPATGSPVNTGCPTSTPACAAAGTNFVAAWQNIWNVWHGVQANGQPSNLNVTNVKFVWTVTAWSLRQQGNYVGYKFYPGDQYVDYIATDAYNWNTCHNGKWQPMSYLLTGQEPDGPAPTTEPAGQLPFGALHPSKGLMLMEYDSVEDPNNPDHKAQWLADTESLLESAPYQQYWAILMWGTDPNSNPCGYSYDSSTTGSTGLCPSGTSCPSPQAWANLSADPSFGLTSLPSLAEITVQGSQAFAASSPSWTVSGQPSGDTVPGLACDVYPQGGNPSQDEAVSSTLIPGNYTIDGASCLSDGLYDATGNPDSANAISDYLGGTFVVTPTP